MPLNVNLGYDNDISDPPPSYDDTQIARTHVASPTVQSSDLNYVELNTLNYYDSARLFLTSPIDEPPPSYDDLPPSYDEFLAIHRSKPSQVHSLPPNCANDRDILYMTIPVEAIETARDSQTTLIVPETEMLCTQV